MKKNHHCLGVVVTSDMWIKFAEIWRDLQAESLTNVWEGCSIHLCQVLNVTPRNEDWTVSVKFHASPDRWKDENHTFSGFQPHWWLPFVTHLLLPGPFPSPNLDRVMPGLSKGQTHLEHSQRIVKNHSGLSCTFNMCTSDLSRFHISNSSAGHVFQAMLQRSQLHIFPNLLISEPQVHKSGELSIACFSRISWNHNTMFKYCKFL